MKKILSLLSIGFLTTSTSFMTISCNKNNSKIDLSKLNSNLFNDNDMEANKSLMDDLGSVVSNLKNGSSKAIHEFYSEVSNKNIIISGVEKTNTGDVFQLNYNSDLISNSEIKISINVNSSSKYFIPGIYTINPYIKVSKILLTNNNKFELSSSDGNGIDQVRAQLAKLVHDNINSSDVKINIAIFDANNNIVPTNELDHLLKGATYNIFIMQLNNKYFNVYNGNVDYKVICI